MDKIQEILSQVALISNKHEQIDQSTGRCFNIFDITNISWKEVQICRVIAELINPNGSHYQKGKYLKLFCENVLGFEPSDDACNNAKTHREYAIKNDRRIDLFIEIGNRKIPIEVKIDAGDQDGQCFDYYKYAVNSKIYYLSVDGHEPDDGSKVDLGEKEMVCVSFGEHILEWLDECLKDKETIKLAPIREILLQFELVVRNMTGQLEEDKAMEIKEILMQSSINMISALEIEKAVQIAKTEMIKNVLCALGDEIKIRYPHLDGYELNLGKINEVLFNIGNNKQFAVEIDWNIFAGIYDTKTKEYDI